MCVHCVLLVSDRYRRYLIKILNENAEFIKIAHNTYAIVCPMHVDY